MAPPTSSQLPRPTYSFPPTTFTSSYSPESFEVHSKISKLNQTQISQIQDLLQSVEHLTSIRESIESSLNPNLQGFRTLASSPANVLWRRLLILLNRTFFWEAIWKIYSSYC